MPDITTNFVLFDQVLHCFVVSHSIIQHSRSTILAPRGKKMKGRFNLKRKRLGILAGMGPRSTAPFLNLVYDECQRQYGAKYDIDYPEIAIMSWPTPFYIDRPIDDKELADSIIQGLRELEKSDVDITAIPCNSAHKYFDQLAQRAKSKLLNIIDLTTANISADAQRVALLATRPTMNLNLYQRACIDQHKEYIFHEKWQIQVDHIITLIKSNIALKEIHQRYADLESELMDAGVDTVIFACTDLSVLLHEDRRIKTIDSSQTLARALIREYLRE